MALALVAAVGWWRWPTAPRPIAIAPGERLVVDRAALAEVDLARTHAELVPSWVVARGALKGLAAHEWQRGVDRDQNLGALAARILQLHDADPVLNGNELLGLVATWNAYLDRAGAPWRLEGEVLIEPGGGGLLALRSYRVMYDGVTKVDGRSYRTRLQRRARRRISDLFDRDAVVADLGRDWHLMHYDFKLLSCCR